MSPRESPDYLPVLLKRLWRHIGEVRRRQFLWLLLLMIITALAEVVSIGVLLPFLMALASPEKVLLHRLGQPLFEAMSITSAPQLLFFLTAAFCAAALGAGALRVAVLLATTRLSCTTGADISIGIYRRTLYQPYLVHVSRNTSEVIAGVTMKTNYVISNVFGPALTLASSVFMLLAIVGTLMFVNYLVAITAFLGFGALYGLAAFLTRHRVAAASQRITIELNHAIKSLQEGLSGIRDVLIDGSQNTYCEEYRSSDLRMRHAQASLLFISQCPRYVIEALGMVLIAGIAYMLSVRDGGFLAAMPVLGALALGGQRLLPVIQQAFAAWTSMLGGRSQLKDTVDLLDQPLPEDADAVEVCAMPFERAIDLRAISFRYSSDTPWVLKKIDLKIKKGARVGFIGATGAGKSTLIDLVMGLLPPTQGVLEIDGVTVTPANHRAWQALIAHVPQAIFLSDRSVAENIAFGHSNSSIDMVRVKEAARQAQISELVESWSQGYNTVVGERGIRLSGGQRQRIGIARALYKRAQVIVFDEATSALDSETEVAVMKAIEALGDSLTILIIAHRLTTLRMCDEVVEIDKEGVLRVGTYAEIAGAGQKTAA